jgi:endo-1,4-beta-xylanase
MKYPYILLLSLVTSNLVNGQNLLSNGTFETGSYSPFNLWTSSSDYQTALSVTANDPHAGNNAMIIDVQKSDPTNTNYYDKIWRVQVTQSGFSASEGEKLLFSFWAKADAPHKMQFGITKNSTTYADFSVEEIDLTTEWKQYEMEFISPVTTTTDIRAIFKCGASVGQYYIDDVSMTRQGLSDLNWYANAEKRIAQIRKGDFTLTVQDENGNPLKNCDVTVSLKQHDFKWGTALSFQSAISADETWYRNTAADYFNNAVFENDFKWPSMEYTNGQVSYTAVDRYLDWGADMNIGFRGHNLVWVGKQAAPPSTWWMTPSWLWNVSSDSAYKLIERRIKRDVTHYRGRIFEYDVINEAVHETALANWLGDSVNVLAFKWAKEADPDAALYINDYSNIDGNTTSKYKSYINYLLSKDAPVEGIGLQAHFGNYIDWMGVKSRLDYLGDLGLPLKITEFDMNVKSIGMTEEQQASEYAKMMRIAFSHPDVEGFLFWGFWDSRHWLQNAGIFRADKTAKPAADSVYKLIHKTWSTTLTLKTDQNGQISFNGFYGTYDVRATSCVPGKYAETSFTKSSLSNAVELSAVITGVVSNQERDQVTIFPNPATNKATLDLVSAESLQTEYVLLSITGQVVKTEKVALNTGANTVDVDVFDLKPGVYMLKLKMNDKLYVSKLIKSE